MALRRRDVVIASIALFVAWGYAVHWVPSLRWAGYAFTSGLVLPPLALIALILSTSRGVSYGSRNAISRPKGLAFLDVKAWDLEVASLRARQTYKRKPLYAGSFLISDALDELLDFIIRDFVERWYSNISSNPIFPNEVDNAIRLAVGNIRDRFFEIDLVEVITTRFIPIMTAHFKDFYDAERAVRGKHLNRNITESEELDLAIAGKYNNGKLHPAASLAFSDTHLIQQGYLRTLTKSLVPKVLPERNIDSRAVLILIEELVACAVLEPVMQILSDPDTWNQLMEAYGRTTLQDRSTVRKLRAALDEHASPTPKSRRLNPFPKLCPGDNERKFEKFVRAIRKTNNLSDARRFRSEVSSQLKRDSQIPDQVYLRRLDVGKRMLDQRVNQMAAGTVTNGTATALQSQPTRSLDPAASPLETASLVDLLHDSSGLSYFMEYMDRQHMMPMVQFWIVVDGFRNPLEDDVAEDDDLPAALPSWTESDRLDLAQINEAYLSRPELQVAENAKQAVREFLKAGKSATPQQYFLARNWILRTQTAALETMQGKYFEGFKKSDLFYKCLTSQEASKKMTSTSPNLALEANIRPEAPLRASTTQLFTVKPNAVSRVSSRLMPKTELRRAAASSTDLGAAHRKQIDELATARRSLDEGSSPLFDDDDLDGSAMSGSVQSLIHDQEENLTPDTHVVQAMEAALNNIMEDAPNAEDYRGSLFAEEASPVPSLVSPRDENSPSSSVDVHRVESEKPNIGSLGLVNMSSRIGVFTDDDLFPDEERNVLDEHEDPEEDKDSSFADEIHEAAPGDLGLAEAITALTIDIDRLTAQNAVIDSLTRKAELTNNSAELRILRKSKSSMDREIRRKELQRQQYVVQESDNSLYGRSTIKIKSILVGKDEDGREYAVYVVEVQRQAGEQMPAASWAVSRRYSEFHDLHQRLREMYPSVKNLDFPRRRMVMKLQNDFLQKRRQALEKYLRELLLLPDVCRSRELRSFLSQSVISASNDINRPENKKDMITRFYNSVTDGMDDILGNIPVLDQLSVAGQNLLSAATNQLAAMPSLASEDPVAAAEAEAELNAFENRELEPFVKPICDIFLEVFELNRGNNWLRGRAVVVVLHQLLGGTIERKIRDNVKGLVQEDGVMRYIDLVKDTMWPAGQRRESKSRTASERSKSRKEASLMLATLIPELAAGVVGRVNAQAASRRIFATFNNTRLNSHLAFTLLDELVDVLFGHVHT
ncbi:MAG: Intermediate filament protein [Claussenomyces sp. TS43310]|nr:MAG: Intermediate filament protein [Claussenomyces sp. TS43310]